MKLLLGGGSKHKDGFTNIDILPLKEVDIVANLAEGIPLDDNSVDEVLAENILEHLPDTVFIMEEIWRVCKPTAKVVIKVPYFKSTAAFKDPTHIKFFTERTMEYFDRNFVGRLPDNNYKCNFKTDKIIFNYYTRGTKYIPFVFLMRRFFWDIVKTIVFELTVIK